MPAYARVSEECLICELVESEGDICYRFHPDIQWTLVAPNEVDTVRAALADGKLVAIAADGAINIAERTPPLEDRARLIRSRRKARLDIAAATLQRHITQKHFDIPTTLTNEEATAWAAYAQALRDVPQQRSFPVDVTWPVPPASLTRAFHFNEDQS